jgi:hypothetical protein
MKHGLGRIARRTLAPKAVILGVSTFQFGWALTEYLPRAEERLSLDAHFTVFLAFALLAAAACLTTGGTRGRFWAAFLCSPMPLAHAFIFWASARGAVVTFFSGEHVRVWLEDMASESASFWTLTAVSFAIFTSAVASTMRAPSSRETIRRS